VNGGLNRCCDRRDLSAEALSAEALAKAEAIHGAALATTARVTALPAANGETPMPVSVDWTELLHAFEFASLGGPYEHEAVLCRKTGKFLWNTDVDEDIEAWPDDADDEEKYLSIPHRKQLDLGKPLVLAFARQCLPEEFDEIRRIFDRRGAYKRFRDLLARKRARDRWYEFEAKATEAALRNWCDVNGITIEPGAGPASEPERR